MARFVEEGLHLWLDEHPWTKLVVIDILEKVRPQRKKHGSVYADDYNALAPLQRIAQERGIAIIVVHHSNKVRAEDFRETPSGSMSLIGACDTLWVLQRLAGQDDAVLKMTGRDIETQELALHFADDFWTALGDAQDYRMSQASKAVLDALQTAGKPLTPKQLAQRLHVPEGTMRVRLIRMAKRGEVLSLGDGRYLPRVLHEKSGAECVTPVMSVTPVTPVIPLPDEQRGGVSVPGDEDMAGSCAPESNSDVTHPNGRKDRGFEASGYSVTPVTPSDAFAMREMIFPDLAILAPPLRDDAGGPRYAAEGHFTVDAVCPKCHRASCVAYGARGRVCMHCGYCERPDEQLE